MYIYNIYLIPWHVFNETIWTLRNRKPCSKERRGKWSTYFGVIFIGRVLNTLAAMVMERAEFSSKEVPFQDFQKQKKLLKMASPSPHHFCWGWGWTSFVYSTRGLVQHKNNGILFPQVSDGWTVEPLFEDVWTEPNTSKTLICCQVTLWRPNQWTKKHWHWAQNPKVLIHEIYLPCSSISPVVFV